jgi:hypothetical protein
MGPKPVHKKKVIPKKTKNEKRREAMTNPNEFSANTKGFTSFAAPTAESRPNIHGMVDVVSMLILPVTYLQPI